MAQMPIEIIIIGKQYQTDIKTAILVVNKIQDEFVFSEIENSENYQLLNFSNLSSDLGFERIDQIRKEQKGFHPYVIAIVDSSLSNLKAENLFAHGDPLIGIGIISTNNIENIIFKSTEMVSYFLYFFAGYLLRFIIPNKKSHDEIKACIYDYKTNKRDIYVSMQRDAFCDECRTEIMAIGTNLSSKQFNAINLILEYSDRFLNNGFSLFDEDLDTNEALPEVIPIQNGIKIILEKDAHRFSIIFVFILVMITVISITLLIIYFGWDTMEPFMVIFGLLFLLHPFILFKVFGESLQKWDILSIYHQVKNIRKEKLFRKYGVE